MFSNELCYEYFDCKEYTCSRRKYLERQCWEIDEVECQTHSNEFKTIRDRLGSKLEACKLCMYYQNNHR